MERNFAEGDYQSYQQGSVAGWLKDGDGEVLPSQARGVELVEIVVAHGQGPAFRAALTSLLALFFLRSPTPPTPHA